ncbi:MAG: hypothetical protein J1G02_00495 [Clostridiales bacterium]|nr:hypothetical protein [Clostridiales bacterium]
MKTNEIIKTSAEILNLGLPQEYFDSEVLPDDNVVKILLNSCNFVYEELYRDYATSLRKTVVEVIDGFADTASLHMCRVISLLDEQGCDVNYRYGDGGLYVQSDGKYNLCYARLPDVLGWGDQVHMPSPRITERTFVYGIVREFYAVTGDWELAKAWDTRFKDALQVAGVKTSSMRMPARGWL